jgi:hypothetical protein
MRDLLLIVFFLSLATRIFYLEMKICELMYNEEEEDSQ